MEKTEFKIFIQNEGKTMTIPYKARETKKHSKTLLTLITCNFSRFLRDFTSESSSNVQDFFPPLFFLFEFLTKVKVTKWPSTFLQFILLPFL